MKVTVTKEHVRRIDPVPINWDDIQLLISFNDSWSDIYLTTGKHSEHEFDCLAVDSRFRFNHAVISLPKYDNWELFNGSLSLTGESVPNASLKLNYNASNELLNSIGDKHYFVCWVNDSGITKYVMPNEVEFDVISNIITSPHYESVSDFIEQCGVINIPNNGNARRDLNWKVVGIKS